MERKHTTSNLKLEEMTAERHWLGFDVFVWSAVPPMYTYVPPKSYPGSGRLVELELYKKYHNSW